MENYLKAPLISDYSPKRVVRSVKTNTAVSSFQLNEALANADFGNHLRQFPAFSNAPTYSPDYRLHSSSSSTVATTIANLRSRKPVNGRSALPAKVNQPAEQIPPNLPSETANTSSSKVSAAVNDTMCSFSGKDEPVQERVKDINPIDTILKRAESSLRTLQALRTYRDTPNFELSAPSEACYCSDINRVDKPLADTKKAQSYAPSARPDVENQELLAQPLMSDMLIHARQGFDGAGSDADCYQAQIQLLLHGFADAFDDNPEVDDETVRRLLDQGGPPPSQVVFPTLYRTGQSLLARLAKAKQLRVTINNISVASVRFCVRRNGSLLRIHPPNSVSGHIAATDIALSEFDSWKKGGTKLDHLEKLKSNSAKLAERYFSGEINLERSVSFSVSMTDEVVKAWLTGPEADSSVIIQLVSPLLPLTNSASSRTKGAPKGTSEPIVFGSVAIPLRGLLCSDELDATAQCFLHADPSTLASVLLREQAMPDGRAAAARRAPLGSVLGSITVRITMMGEAFDHIQEMAQPAATLFAHPNSNANAGTDSSRSVLVDAVHQALSYVPIIPAPPSDPVPEALPQFPDVPLISTSSHSASAINSPAGATPVTGCWALVVLACHGRIPCSIIPSQASFQLVLSYKTSLRDRVRVSSAALVNRENQSLFAYFGQYHVHQHQTLSQTIPVLEVWAVLASGSEMFIGIGRSNIVAQNGSIVTVQVALPGGSELTASGERQLSINVAYVDGPDAASVTSLASKSVAVFTELCEKAEFGMRGTGNSSEDDDASTRDSLEFGPAAVNSLLNSDAHVSVQGVPRPQDVIDTDEPQIVADLDSKTSIVQPFDEDETPRSSSDLPVAEASECAKRVSNSPIESLAKDPTFLSPLAKTVHIVDISIEGTCDWRDVAYPNLAAAGLVDASIGCFVFYEWPSENLESHRSAELHHLWVDADCAVLNSSRRHRVDATASGQPLEDVLFPANETGARSTFPLYLVHCDADGGLPAHLEDRTVFGYCSMRCADLRDVLGDSGGSKLLQLPITWLEPAPLGTLHRRHLLGLPLASLSLLVSHRIEPLLMRCSSKKLLDFVEGASVPLPSDISRVNISTSRPSQPLADAEQPDPHLFDPLHWMDLLPSLQRFQQDAIGTAGTIAMSNEHSPFDGFEVPPSHMPRDNAPNEHTQFRLELRIESVRDLSNVWIRQHNRKSLYFTGTVGLQDQVVGSDSFTCKPLSSSFTSTTRPVSEAPDGKVLWDEVQLLAIKRLSHTSTTGVDKRLLTERLSSTPSTSHANQMFTCARNVSIALTLYGREEWRLPSEDAHNANYHVQIGDVAIGTAVIDLTMLALGVPSVCGWYHIRDHLQNCQGLVQVSVTPLTQIVVVDADLDRPAVALPNIDSKESIAPLPEIDEADTSEIDYSQLQGVLHAMETTSFDLRSKYFTASSLVGLGESDAPVGEALSRSSSMMSSSDAEEECNNEIDVHCSFTGVDLPDPAVSREHQPLPEADTATVSREHQMLPEPRSSGHRGDVCDDAKDIAVYLEGCDDILDNSHEYEQEQQPDEEISVHEEEPTGSETEIVGNCQDNSNTETSIEFLINSHDDSMRQLQESQTSRPRAASASSYVSSDIIDIDVEAHEAWHEASDGDFFQLLCEESICTGSSVARQSDYGIGDVSLDERRPNCSFSIVANEFIAGQIFNPIPDFVGSISNSPVCSYSASCSDAGSSRIAFSQTDDDLHQPGHAVQSDHVWSFDENSLVPVVDIDNNSIHGGGKEVDSFDARDEHCSEIESAERSENSISSIEGLVAGVDLQSSEDVSSHDVTACNNVDNAVDGSMDPVAQVENIGESLSLDGSDESELKDQSPEAAPMIAELQTILLSEHGDLSDLSRMSASSQLSQAASGHRPAKDGVSDSAANADTATTESPNTTKIRGIVEREVQKAFHLRDLSRNAAEEAVSRPVHSDGPASADTSLINDSHDVSDIIQSSRPQSLLLLNQITLPAAVLHRLHSNRAQFNRAKSVLPGKQHSFVEKETDRISRIMLGTA